MDKYIFSFLNSVLFPVESSGKGGWKELDGLGTIPGVRAGSLFVHIFSGAFPGYLCTAPGLVKGNSRVCQGVGEVVGNLRRGVRFFPYLGFRLQTGLQRRLFLRVFVLFTVFVYI